ncbi:MAG: sel1 repeat family protein [Magnetococcales bacterium]|nr:sel1 repeat family protein [Magnetococcales bacterium]
MHDRNPILKNLWIVLLVLTLLVRSEIVAADDLEDGVWAFDNFSFTIAFQKLLPLAEQGDATAQALVGRMYHQGNGVAKNDQEAIKWLQKASQQKNAEGMFQLSSFYRERVLNRRQ